MSKYDIDLIIKLRKMKQTWNQIGEVYDTDGENVRAFAKKHERFHEIRDEERVTDRNRQSEVDSKTYAEDGTVTSTIKRKMKEKKTFTKDELLEIHSLNKDEFQIKNITSNEWSMTNAEGEQYYNFQSKILAEPISDEDISYEEVERILSTVQPKEIDLNIEEITDDFLLIPFADMHFELNKREHYKKLESDLKDLIMEGKREILITSHGDFFHVDNFMNTTVRGTRLEDVDIKQGVEDAYQFMINIIESALKHSPCVKLVYLTGNHSSMKDYMFVQGIKRLFPELIVDDEIAEYKHSWLGEHSIFMHHGDKIRSAKRLLETIVGVFPKEWGESKSRYLITGHFHHEKSLSNAGITHYQVSSPSQASGYDKQQGYVTSESYQMVFEFDDEKRSAIYYL